MNFKAENDTEIWSFTSEILWFKNGKWHRENGPACIYSSGYKHWFRNGLYQDGPAIEYPDGIKYFSLEGKFYEEKDYWEIATTK